MSDEGYQLPDHESTPEANARKALEEQERIRVRRWLTVTAQSKAKTIKELEDDIMKLVDWYWEYEKRGIPLAHLNRRFGRIARELFTSARDRIGALHDQRRVALLPHYRTTIVIHPDYEHFVRPNKDVPIADDMERIERVLLQIKQRSMS